MINQIEEYLKNLFAAEPSRREGTVERAKEGLETVERKIRNLLQIVEEGLQGALSVKQRLAELDGEREEYRRQVQTYLIGDNTRSVPNAARLVRDFMEGFEQEFGRASQDERKIMIQKCIAGIVIDREALVARFRVRRIPAVTPEIEKALKSDRNEGFVVSCQSARNRT